MENPDFMVESVQESQEIIQFLDDRIYEYNSSQIQKYDGQLFSKIIRDPNSHIIAGIAGWSWAGASEIILLWVKEEYRAKGLGKKLLQAFEEEAIQKGCTVILLRSYDFQAPFFYEKHGYRIEFVMDNFPQGHKHYTLVKRL